MTGIETIIKVYELIDVPNFTEAIYFLRKSNKITRLEEEKLIRLYSNGWFRWNSNKGILLANLMLKAAKR